MPSMSYRDAVKVLLRAVREHIRYNVPNHLRAAEHAAAMEALRSDKVLLPQEAVAVAYLDRPSRAALLNAGMAAVRYAEAELAHRAAGRAAEAARRQCIQALAAAEAESAMPVADRNLAKAAAASAHCRAQRTAERAYYRNLPVEA